MANKMVYWQPEIGDRIEGRLIHHKHSEALFLAILKSGNGFFILPEEARRAFDIDPVEVGQELEIVRSPSGYYITKSFTHA
jgi:hypothetical protein